MVLDPKEARNLCKLRNDTYGELYVDYSRIKLLFYTNASFKGQGIEVIYLFFHKFPNPYFAMFCLGSSHSCCSAS